MDNNNAHALLLVWKWLRVDGHRLKSTCESLHPASDLYHRSPCLSHVNGHRSAPPRHGRESSSSPGKADDTVLHLSRETRRKPLYLFLPRVSSPPTTMMLLRLPQAEQCLLSRVLHLHLQSQCLHSTQGITNHSP